MKKLISSFFLVALLLLIPTQVTAVEFTIEETNIHAQLKADGSVQVKETHTYDFSDDFNGITRTLIPKQRTSITKLTAEEEGAALKVEQEGNLYKIFRGGSDENVTIDLSYTIENGVEVFEDVAQFYWPFFDENSEATYENLTITIEPPVQGEIKAAYGYEAAYQTVTTTKEGNAVFDIGKVSEGTNGDIRVAYDASLFPNASVTSFEPMLNEILADQSQLDETIASEKRSEAWWRNFAIYLSSGLSLLAALLIISAIRKRMEIGREAERQKSSTGNFPETKMSLPALMLFTNYGHLSSTALTAALMELVHKGNIEQISEREFKRTDRTVDFAHEERLMELLFEDIAHSDHLHLDDFEAFIKEEDNHEKYRIGINGWKERVKMELQQYEWREPVSGPRWISAGAALVSFPFIILFPFHNLFLWMSVSILLFLFFTTFSIGYRPLNAEGRKLKNELKSLHYSDRWKEWEEKDRVPALLYQIGVGKQSASNHSFAASTSDDWVMFLALSAAVQASFESADEHTSVHAASGGFPGDAGGGAGVGGGGGGSGAF